MRTPITKLVLVGFGSILILIGAAMISAPKAFLAMSQVHIEADPSLLSELAAPSGILLIAGLFMMVGAIKRRFTEPAILVGAVVYGSYGIARLVTMFAAGIPSQSLVAATVMELVVATLLVGLLLTDLERQPSGPETSALEA